MEIGAFNGISESISLRFEKDLNWSGLLVEPNPLHFKYLKRNRPKNICLNYICLSEEYLDKKHIDMAAERYIDLCADYGVSDIAALERRFQKVLVEPTSVEETIEILENIKEKYEEHHNVTYTKEALEACVKLTNRYMTDRFLPDKAIDALDEAGSRVHIININVPKKILELEQKLEEVRDSEAHLPGSKIINAFYKGYDSLDFEYDVICKYDADVVFPENYLETLTNHYRNNSKLGMVAGHCYIEKNGKWQLENLTSKKHIRGPLKCVEMKPKKGAQIFHTDGNYQQEMYLISIATEDITLANGPTEVCVGSHLRSMSFDEFFFSKKDKKKLTMKKGQILIRKHNLWHRGTKNFSNKQRLLLSFIMIPKMRKIELYGAFKIFFTKFF